MRCCRVQQEGRWHVPWRLYVCGSWCTPLHNRYHTGMELPTSQWDFVTYTSLLKQCDNVKALPTGQWIHDQIYRNGFEHYLPLNNLLLQMYGKCGLLDIVCRVFAQMCHRDLYSWNFLIRAYVQHGGFKLAFVCFLRMQEEGLAPNTNIFSSLLSGEMGSVPLFKGQQVHVQIAGSRCEDDAFVSTALITMYGNCGHLEDAWEILCQTTDLDVVPCNVMISVYVEHGCFDDGLKLYDRMAFEGLVPTKVTFVNTLAACNSEAFLNEGKKIHTRILCSEYSKEIVVGTALLNMYGKCGHLEGAQLSFNGLHEWDKVSWNAIIAAHVQNGKGKNALQLFWSMPQDSILWDNFTFVSTLSACGDEGSAEEGKKLHALLSACGADCSTIIGNALINMYAKCASLEDSWMMFGALSTRDAVSWNQLISAYTQHGRGDGALQMFEQMQQEGMLPNDVTFVSMFELLRANPAVQAYGQRLHARLLGSTYETDVSVGNAVVSMYGNWGRLKDVKALLDVMPKRDTATFIHFFSACTSQAVLKEGQLVHTLVVCLGLDSELSLSTAILTMYSKCLRMNEAWMLFDRVKNRDVVLWTAMITACTSNGLIRDALDLFEEMQRQGMKADGVTMINMLDSCASQAALAEGKCMHRHVMVGAFESDIVVGTALLNMYGKCGMLADACRVFDNLVERDTITWTVLIASYAQQGHAKEALDFFKKMKQAGVLPNEITFIHALNACSHAGLVGEGQECFRSMRMTYGIMPGVEHYNCIVDMLAKAGLVDEAEALINEMPLTPGQVTWTTLLGACKDKEDAKRGERVVHNVFEVDPVNASPYVALSNMYSV